MSKLVDKERLAKLAAALDARAKAAVKAEKERAKLAEKGLQNAINAINNEESGILAQAKDYVDEKVEEINGAAEDLEGRVDTLEGLVGNPAEGEEAATGLHLALDNAKEELNQAIVTEKGRAEGQEAAIRQEMADALGNYSVEADENGEGAKAAAGLRKEIEDAHNAMNQAAATEAARVDKKIADDIAAESALRVAEEQRIEKALADEAAEIRGEMAEQHQAMNKAVEEAIAAVQADVDQNEADCDAAIAGEKERAEAKEAELLQAINKEVEDRGKAVQDLANRHDQEMDAAEGRLDAVEEDIARLDGDVNVEGSVKKQIKNAIDVVNQAADGLADRVEAVENFRDVTYPAAEAKVREDFAAADATNLQAAKDYANQQITALVDSAPDAMNTLNELATAIKGNKDVYDAYVQEHAAAMTKMKEDLQKEIDDDVKAVVDAQKLVNDAQAETNENFEGRIAANEAFVAAQPAIDQAQNDRIKALEDANAEGGAVAEAIQAAQDAADAAQADVDAVEKRLDDEGGLVDRLEAAEAFVAAHSHEAMEQGIADNKAAIEAEVGKDGEQGNRDKAIAAALEAYSTTEEVKQILGNVVATLALSMENDKVVLKLGGAEGIALSEVSLDLATDDDIDAIIAGLDPVEGE